VTRAVASPTLEEPIALAMVDTEVATGDQSGDLTVRVDGEERPTERAALPFIEGSDRSARLPEYPE